MSLVRCWDNTRIWRQLHSKTAECCPNPRESLHCHAGDVMSALWPYLHFFPPTRLQWTGRQWKGGAEALSVSYSIMVHPCTLWGFPCFSPVFCKLVLLQSFWGNCYKTKMAAMWVWKFGFSWSCSHGSQFSFPCSGYLVPQTILLFLKIIIWMSVYHYNNLCSRVFESPAFNSVTF